MVANRLPVDKVTTPEGETEWRPSPGGLVTAMQPVMKGREGAWVGWTGEAGGDAPEPFEADDMWLQPIALSASEVEDHYEGFSNDTLWPIYHDVIVPARFRRRWYDGYRRVNHRFAEIAASVASEGATIWVHDYQLQLVPQMLRTLRPDVRIGWFNHIPFPPIELFAQIPWRRELLEGLLGADLLGFQRPADAQNFLRVVRRLLDLPVKGDHVTVRGPGDSHGRQVKACPFPISVDAEGMEALAKRPDVIARAKEIRADLGNPEHVLLGIDRLDYTKGIRHRLKAYQELLADGAVSPPETVLVQVATPSRERVGAYRVLRDQVEVTVGRINGEEGRIGMPAVHYLHHSYPKEEMAALYLAADVMVVTPLRDGMNLVAKEFVACRNDESGVLVLSEFAGAAHELAEAIHVNPFDVAGMAESFYRAMSIGAEEQTTRMQALRRRVFGFNVHRWAETFLTTLEHERESAPMAAMGASAIRELAARMRAAERLVVLIDYDGTLVPIADTPALARPDAEALSLLSRLAARPGTEVHVVSGRPRDTLERWLGGLPIHLHAEHGFWSRAPGEAGRVIQEGPAAPWKEKVLGILREYAERTPGTLVEEKPTGLAWHYRMADPEFGPQQANEMRLHLTELLSNTPVQILSGRKVIELRAQGVNKGLIVPAVTARNAGALLVALGDDTTDEDLFAALPPEAVCIHVGPGETRRERRMRSPREVRLLLRLVGEPPVHGEAPNLPAVIQ